GEVDILEVIDDVQRRFATDPDRVYVMGHSMGGAGSYTLGLHFPDRFGGITPIDAALGSRLTISAELPDWMKPQAALYRPENLAANARNVPVFMKHAGAGIQGDSMFFTDAVTAEGGFSTTESFPGMPHGFAQRYSYANFISQLIEHPIRRDPPEVKLFTTTLRFNSAYWVTVDRLRRHNAPSRVHVSLRGDALMVKTENIDALTLRPPNPGAATSLTADRNPIHFGGLPTEVHLSKVNGRWEMVESPPLAGKRHGLQGPVS
ncbi:MAG: prolyl oligopeptidase family serine peptidase, partial [bacterium]|nr:prolyl oligopeptidase family serine peptidase [bacterium]